jgi:uncharacterized protein YlxW (UPF0749 family)
MNIDWKNMSNVDIRNKMNSMTNEYEYIKNEINKLISKLDSLDSEYNNAKKELNRRAKQ